jgi:methionine-gamma-lyase
MEAIAGLARKYERYTAVDNTFCTPYLQQPLRFGIDFVVHSTTKYLNGHGNSTAGAIIGRDKSLMKDKVWRTMKLVGTNCNPFDAWLINNGLKTLELRMERHCSNAMRAAQFLEKHSKVAKVNYVGLPSHPDHELASRQMRCFSGMLSFELTGGMQAGIDFINKLRFCVLAPTMGDVDTLAMHPASMSHSAVPREIRLLNGITDGLVRLSVGIENIEDILADLDQALLP